MSGKRLQLKRGTTAQTSTFTGLNGEVTVDTTKKTLIVHDGTTMGGTVLAKDSDVVLKVDKVVGKQLSTEDYTTAEKSKLAGIASGANNYTHPTSGVGAGTYRSVTVDTNGHITDGTNPTTISGYGLTDAHTKTEVNTLLALKINNLEKGVANGVATLDASGLVPSSQLPSYVDDVLEYNNLASFPATGETGKIYVAKDTNKTYRWSGSVYIQIYSGAVDSVAGKTGAVTLTSSDVGLGNVTNESKATMFTNPTFTGTATGTFSGSLSGNAATATNVAWSGITAKPTSLSGYGITDSVKNFGTVTVQGVAGSNQSCTTDQFITWLSNIGALSQSCVMKCTWDYAGNNNISDTGFDTLETAGCFIQVMSDGAQYIIRITSPSTGTGAGGIHEYINHGSGYSPGWRRVYTSNLNGNISGNAATATTAANATKLNGQNWYWSGQGGQPNWLWGGNDGTNMYVYNPSNFSVNYANSAGYAAYTNVYAGNEMLLANGYTGGSLYMNYRGSSGAITEYRMCNGLGNSGLAQVTASQFNGNLNGTASNGVISSSNAATGYIKFGNGLIIQWGSVSGAKTGSTVTFPIAFPTLCASVVFTGRTGLVSSSNTNPSTTSFYWHDNTAAESVGIRWIAIGY